jgi:hypothetical protein
MCTSKQAGASRCSSTAIVAINVRVFVLFDSDFEDEVTILGLFLLLEL